MRIFVAVFPPPEVQQAAFAVVERLRRPDDGVSWVQLQNLHYTMHFMGELGEGGLSRVIDAAGAAVRGRAPFSARLGTVGAFPDARRARVLWLGLSEGAEPLVALARGLDRELVGRGFERAGRAFSAHLTIGRPRRPEDWTARLAAAGAPTEAPAFTVDRLQVVHSTLSPGGSIYRVQAEAFLTATVTR